MVYNLLVNGVYWGYNPLTNHLLTSWDIQVHHRLNPGPPFSSCNLQWEIQKFARKTHRSIWENFVASEGRPKPKKKHRGGTHLRDPKRSQFCTHGPIVCFVVIMVKGAQISDPWRRIQVYKYICTYLSLSPTKDLPSKYIFTHIQRCLRGSWLSI